MNRVRLHSLNNQTEQSTGKHHVKIELMVCQAGGHQCKEHLSVINECYLDAGVFHSEKDYLSSIQSLKCAFFKTGELNQDTCISCAKLFRSTITQSLENINGELKNLTTGLFRKRRYQKIYLASREILNEIKQEQ